MARLLGFQKTKTESASKVVSLLEKTYLNRTKYGEFNTVDEVDGFIKTLQGLPQTTEVQEKIADMQNKKLQLGAKLNDILSEKNVFDTDLQEALGGAAKNNFTNLKSLIGSYAAIYGDAADRYDQEILAKVGERYGTASNIPQETLDYRKKLADKAKLYSSMFNAYNVQDPNSGEIGMLNPDNFAVVVDTNPTNGAIQHLDIVPSGEVDKNYMRTEVGVNVIPNIPNKKLPVYLRTNDVGVTSDGKTIRGAQLGNITYQGATESTKDEGISAGVLAPHKENVGFFSKLNIFNDTPQEKLNKSIDQIKDRGVDFNSGAYQFDSNQVPNEAVLRMGNRVFYSTGKNDEILEITGKTSQEKQDNLNSYLKNVGKDPNKMLPYFITKDYLTAPDGSSRVKDKVDANFFNPVAPSSSPTSFNTVSPQTPVAASNMPADLGFFAQRAAPKTANSTPETIAVNRQKKPGEPTESSSGKISIGDVIEKGKSFFRNKIA